MDKKVGVVRDKVFLEHNTGYGHPECKERLIHIYRMLDESGLSKELIQVPLRKATEEEILLIHTKKHYETIASTQSREETYLDGDTPASSRSFETALYAVGSLLNCVDYVMDKRVSYAVALVRPPGHHAEADRAMGFCLFNNVAIAGAYTLKNYGLQKVLIVDFDVHHGNGTQHSFYSDPRVLYFSTHRYPFYPGTGHFSEVGNGKGEGFTVNVPLPYGCGDEEYITIFNRVLVPVASEYKPEFVFVSAGFDSYHLDPLGGMRVTEDGYARMMQILLSIAERFSNSRLILALEGGYDLEGIARCLRAVIEQMLGKREEVTGSGISMRGIDEYLEQIKKYYGKYWKAIGDEEII